jgi:hypothetical protein
LSGCPAWNQESGYGYGHHREHLKNCRAASGLEGYSEERKQENEENE